VEAGRKQGSEGKLEERQEGDKWVYDKLWKIQTRSMVERGIDPCHCPSRCKETLP